MTDFAIPRGVRLSHPELPVALAAVGIVQRTYLANALLNHSFTDRIRRHRRLFVVESSSSKTPGEITGDTTLWLLVRETARRVNAASELEAIPGEPTELAAA